MPADVYELIALGARYVFAALMTLIVLRAWRITLVDSRRAGALRRLSPQTGLSGELLVLAGDEKARRGMRYPVIREGMIGASRRSDIRIRHSSIRRKHAYFQLTEQGLSIQARPGAAMRGADGRPATRLLLSDGAEFTLGRVRMLLVLSEALDGEAPPEEGEDWDALPGEDDAWDTPANENDDLFLEERERGQF